MALVGGCILPKAQLVSSFDDETPTGGAMSSGGSSSGAAGHAGSSGKPNTAGASMGGHSSGAGGESGSAPVAGSPSGGAGSGGSGVAGGAGGAANGGTAGAVAAGGEGGLGCPTAAYDLVCGGVCVISASNPSNCGTCGKACGMNQSCTGGKCGCSQNYTMCGGVCLPEDVQHCGPMCGACSGAAECMSSACVTCPTGCALINAPLNSEQDQSYFKIPLSTAVDLNDATINLRYNTLAPTVTFGVGVLNSIGQEHLYIPTVHSSYGWDSLSFQVKTNLYDFSKTVAIEVYVAGSPGATTNPTKVYIDNISIDTGILGPWDFSSGTAPLVLGTTTVMSTLTWVHP